MVQPDGTSRISKIDTYLNVAEAFAYRSTCLKRKYGAVIVKDDVVVSTGYNGSPRGYTNCCDIGTCPRIERDLHQGQGEKEVNLAIAEELKACLEEAGIQVVMTRSDAGGLYQESDENKKQADMRARCAIIDEAGAELTVSVHQNSYPAESVRGPQVFYHAQSSEGQKAAACLQEALNQELSITRPREIKANNTYYILKKTKTPVVIAECGFLSNYEEAEKLTTKDYQKQVAHALCSGILAYLEASGG